MEKNPYKILGVSLNAASDDIKILQKNIIPIDT